MSKLAVAVITVLALVGLSVWVILPRTNSPDTAGITLDIVSFGCFGQTATFTIVLTRPNGGAPFVNVDVRYDVFNIQSGKITGQHTKTYLLSSGEIEKNEITFQINAGEICNSDSYSAGRARIVSVKAY